MDMVNVMISEYELSLIEEHRRKKYTAYEREVTHAEIFLTTRDHIADSGAPYYGGYDCD